MTQDKGNRRPIAARSTALARVAAGELARAGIGPDAISLASLVFAVLAAVSLVLAPLVGSFFYLLAAIFVPLRLVANLLDGMVAVEHDRGGPLGPLFNELPDRAADVAILVAAGYAAGLVPGSGGVGSLAVFVGWLAALLAVLTAYVREFGCALGAPADFGGPFAKQQRMWAVIAGALIALLLPRWAGVVLALMLVVVCAGTAYTLYRRIMRLADFLHADAALDVGPGGAAAHAPRDDVEPAGDDAADDEETARRYRTSDSDGDGRTSSPRET